MGQMDTECSLPRLSSHARHGGNLRVSRRKSLQSEGLHPSPHVGNPVLHHVVVILSSRGSSRPQRENDTPGKESSLNSTRSPDSPISCRMRLSPQGLKGTQESSEQQIKPKSHRHLTRCLDLSICPFAIGYFSLQERILHPMRVIPHRAHVRLRVIQHIRVEFRSIRNRRVFGKLQRLHADVLQFRLHRVEIGF